MLNNKNSSRRTRMIGKMKSEVVIKADIFTKALLFGAQSRDLSITPHTSGTISPVLVTSLKPNMLMFYYKITVVRPKRGVAQLL